MPTDDPTGVPTEQQARDLLARAGATITVPESAPMTLAGLPDPPRRRGRVALLVAAAAVVAIAGGAVVVERIVDDQPTLPAPAGEPAEKPHAYDADQVPSYLGFDKDAAVADLESRGLRAKLVNVEEGCRPVGVVEGTTPAAGAQVAPGDLVEIRAYSRVDGMDCREDQLGYRAWELARFARGLGAAPEFAPTVTLTAPGGVTRTVDGSALRDRTAEEWEVCGDSTCHSAVATLEARVSRPFTSPSGEPASPNVWLRPAVDGWCGTTKPDVESLSIELPIENGIRCPVDAVWISRDAQDRIAGLELRAPEDVTEEPPREVVAPSKERAASAAQFVRWARGQGEPPNFADRVRHLTAGFAGPWNEEPERREYWAGCSGLGFPDCGLDPIASLVHDPADIISAVGTVRCGWMSDPPADPMTGKPVPLPRGFRDADAVRLQPADSTGCDQATLINLWIRPDGEIYGVGLVLPYLSQKFRP